MSAAAFHSGTSPKRVADADLPQQRGEGGHRGRGDGGEQRGLVGEDAGGSRIPFEDPRDGVAQGDAVDVAPRGTVDDECVGRDVPGARVERERGRHPGQHGVGDRPAHGHRSNGGEVMGVAAD